PDETELRSIAAEFSGVVIDKEVIERVGKKIDYTALTAKIDSDRKRKKDSISTEDRRAKEKGKEREREKSKKRSKPMASGNQVRASHILIKHEGSRRKASWKDPEGRVIMNTTKESAIATLKQFREDILSGKAKFDDVAARHSDCSSAKRGGDLGPFGRGQMQKPFEDATFGLKVGDISDIVDTDSGVHIILRTA
ncbi:Peptidyl-prolyl cis-trans isomerase Pin1, partial [Linum grandiflorum]